MTIVTRCDFGCISTLSHMCWPGLFTSCAHAQHIGKTIPQHTAWNYPHICGWRFVANISMLTRRQHGRYSIYALRPFALVRAHMMMCAAIYACMWVCSMLARRTFIKSDVMLGDDRLDAQTESYQTYQPPWITRQHIYIYMLYYIHLAISTEWIITTQMHCSKSNRYVCNTFCVWAQSLRPSSIHAQTHIYIGVESHKCANQKHIYI